MPSERELCELLDVSRSVVREAVVALEIQGIVEVRGRSGIVVRPKQEDDVRRSNTSLDAVFTSSDLMKREQPLQQALQACQPSGRTHATLRF